MTNPLTAVLRIVASRLLLAWAASPLTGRPIDKLHDLARLNVDAERRKAVRKIRGEE